MKLKTQKKQLLILIAISLVLLFVIQIGRSNDTLDQFDKLHIKWRKLLVSDTYDQTNNAVVQYVSKLSDEAVGLYVTLIKSPDRKYLWPKETQSFCAHFTTQFRNLLKLTLAYSTKGTLFYQDPVIFSTITEGVDFMIEKGYDGTRYTGNWWDWQIGVPENFIKILIILRDNLSHEKVKRYTKAINGYVPNPYKQMHHLDDTKSEELHDLSFIDPPFKTNGANRADLALTVLGLGILQKDAKKIEEAYNSITGLLTLVTYGDGFYQDGSFIQHYTHPHAGGYGNDLLQSICKFLAVIKNSSFGTNETFVQSVVEIVEDAFIPLIYKGRTLAIVNGRSISRAPTNSYVRYKSIVLYTLLWVAYIAPAEQEKKIKEAVKYDMRKNANYYYTNSQNYNELVMTISLLNDKTISGDCIPFMGTKMYASMDRFVQRTAYYMVALSLHSQRISAFEAGYCENKHGWHTGDGMMYLYNDDEVQFNESYWPTVDPYRLPGTTVDTIPLEDVGFYFYGSAVRSREKWVGGVSMKAAAVVGMSLNKNGTAHMNLQGKKSWFFVDGLVVALGAGITGKTKATIETIVENRLLNDQYNYQVLSSNTNDVITAAYEESRKEWLLLQAKSHHQHSSIGYYFPNKETITVIKEQRRGTIREINEVFPSDKVYTGNYAKFIINHGKSPWNASYAYVILPGVNQSNLNEIAIKKPVTIIYNTIDIQAIKLTTSQFNYLGVNIWEGPSRDVEGIWVDKPVSLLKVTKGERATYTISDPTQSNDVVTLKLPRESSEVLNISAGVEIVNIDKDVFIFNVNFTKAYGASKEIILKVPS